MKKILVLLPLFFQMQGCNEANALSPAPVTNIQSEILHQASNTDYGNYTSKSASIIKNGIDYNDELLKRMGVSTKAVDFTKQSVVLIDMGRRASGGYSILVESFLQSGDYVRAKVILNVPGPGCAVTMAETNPFQFIKVNTTAEILITEEVRLISC